MPWDLTDATKGTQAPARTVLTEKIVDGINQGTIVPSDAAPTVSGVHGGNFAAYVLDCIWAVCTKQLEVEPFLRAVRAAGPQPGRASTLAYAFLVVWADIEGPKVDSFGMDLKDGMLSEKVGGPGKLVVDLVSAAHRDGLVSSVDLLEVLDVRLLNLAQIGLADKTGKAFTQRLTQTRVQRAVKINVFLTFREEAEGFGKLVTLLNNSALATLQSAAAVDKEVDQLIGYYSLAPIKVAYCILCALESQPNAAHVRAHRCPHSPCCACCAVSLLSLFGCT